MTLTATAYISSQEMTSSPQSAGNQPLRLSVGHSAGREGAGHLKAEVEKQSERGGVFQR